MRLTLLTLATLASVSTALDILPALRKCGCSSFASYLASADNLPLLREIRMRNDGVIYCPPNDVVDALVASEGGVVERPCKRCGHQKRSGNSGAARNACHSKPRPQKRHCGSCDDHQPYGGDDHQLQPSNYETVITYLEDPEYVNLGSGQPGRMVSSLNAEGLTVLSGGVGSSINQTSGACRYNRGVIYPVDGFVPFPLTVSKTIKQLGLGAEFWRAVCKAGLDKYLDNTPACTVFVPVSWNDKKDDPRRQVVCDFLGYSPELLPGSSITTLADTQIKVEFGPDGGRTVNGQSLQRSDVTTKNGVIHVIAKPF